MTMTEPTTPAPSNALMLSRQAQPPAPVAQAPQLGPMQIDLRVAAELAKSDIVPKAFQGKASNILVAIGLGRSLGLEPAPSLYGMHVIEGTPSPTAKLQAALVRRAGHKLRILEHGAEKAVVQIVRSDDPEYPVTVEFSVEDARAAGYLAVNVERWTGGGDGGRKKKETYPLPEGFPVPCTKSDLDQAGAPQWALPWMVKRRDNWFTNRATMLHHRAVTRAVGMACPEVVSGLDFEIDETVVVETPDPIEVLTPGPSAAEPAPPAESAQSTDVVDAEIVPDTGASTSGEEDGDRSDADQPVNDGPAGADSPDQSDPELTPVEPEAEPEAEAPAPEPISDPNVLGDEYTGANIVSTLKFRQIRQGAAVDHARSVAESLGIPTTEWPDSVQQIAGHPDVNLRRAVAAWVNNGGQV